MCVCLHVCAFVILCLQFLPGSYTGPDLQGYIRLSFSFYDYADMEEVRSSAIPVDTADLFPWTACSRCLLTGSPTACCCPGRAARQERADTSSQQTVRSDNSSVNNNDDAIVLVLSLLLPLQGHLERLWSGGYAHRGTGRRYSAPVTLRLQIPLHCDVTNGGTPR